MTGKLLLLGALVMFSLASCQKSDYNAEPTSVNSLSKKGGNGGGNGKGKGKNNDNEEPQPDPITYDVTYQLSNADDHDPLYRFSISSSGDLMLFETDPTVTTWGTDYWGYWDEPYTYANGEVEYFIGLTYTVYEFTQVSSNTIDVTKTLVVTPYLGGTATTTVTHPGTYTIVQ